MGNTVNIHDEYSEGLVCDGRCWAVLGMPAISTVAPCRVSHVRAIPATLCTQTSLLVTLPAPLTNMNSSHPTAPSTVFVAVCVYCQSPTKPTYIIDARM